MQILDLIETQLVSNRLPLVAVTLAAVPHANTPCVLTLHWHGFVEVKLAESENANAIAFQSVPSSALQVNERWDVTGRVAGIPQWLLSSLGVFSPMMREISASSYQFRMPYVIDSAETEQLLGVKATRWDDALAATVEYYRNPLAGPLPAQN